MTKYHKIKGKKYYKPLTFDKTSIWFMEYIKKLYKDKKDLPRINVLTFYWDKKRMTALSKLKLLKGFELVTYDNDKTKYILNNKFN